MANSPWCIFPIAQAQSKIFPYSIQSTSWNKYQGYPVAKKTGRHSSSPVLYSPFTTALTPIQSARLWISVLHIPVISVLPVQVLTAMKQAINELTLLFLLTPPEGVRMVTASQGVTQSCWSLPALLPVWWLGGDWFAYHMTLDLRVNWARDWHSSQKCYCLFSLNLVSQLITQVIPYKMQAE